VYGTVHNMSKVRFRLIGLTHRCVEESYNFMALKLVSTLLPNDVSLQVHDIKEIPFYEPGLEGAELPLAVSNFQNELIHAQGLVIFTPEYNHSLPARLKNALDWLSRLKPNVLIDLPTMIGSVATGHLGGARVQYELRRVLDSQQAQTLLKPEVFIGSAKSKFNNIGECVDQETIKLLGLQIASFIKLLENAQKIKTISQV